jgi:hypothetical protein
MEKAGREPNRLLETLQRSEKLRACINIKGHRAPLTNVRT